MKATYEPTDEECEWKADDEQELTVSTQVNVASGPPQRTVSTFRALRVASLNDHRFPNCQKFVLCGGHKHRDDMANLYQARFFDEQMSLLNQEEMKEKAKVEDEKKDEEKEDPKGIPEFWLTVFKNVDLLSDMLQVFETFSRSAATCWISCASHLTTFIEQDWNVQSECFFLFLMHFFFFFFYSAGTRRTHPQTFTRH